MCIRLRLAVAAGVLALISLALPAPAAAQKHARPAARRIEKLDEALREALRRPPSPQRVIIRVKPGRESALIRALQAHGDVVARQHADLGLLSGVVHGEDLEPLANDEAVEAVSLDATVFAHGPRARTRSSSAAQKSAAARRQTAPARDTSATRRSGERAKTSRAGASTGNSQVDPAAERHASARRRQETLGLLRRLQGLDYGAPTGRGVGVAVIDSGIEPSEDLRARIWAFCDFTQPPLVDGLPCLATEPYDDYGHGTFVASLIANQGRGNGQYQGVAPGVHLIGLKVLAADGTGRTSAVIDAINFAVRYRHALDIDIINLSLGHPIYESAWTDPLVQAVEHAVRHGLVVVASAGNFGMNPQTHQVGYGGITSPGNAPSAITVGAADTRQTLHRDDDTVAPFSSRGPTWFDGFAKPDLVAPGVGDVARAAGGATLYRLFPSVLLEDDDGDDPSTDPKKFARLSGTSMAAAVASGVAALVLEANPRLTPNAVKAVLEYTATPLTSPGGTLYDALTQGTGEVNGAGAVALAGAIDATVPWGAPWLATRPEPTTRFGGKVAAWAQHIVWGNYRVGASVLDFNSLAWDENIVWGTVARGVDGEALADNIVWGTLADLEQAENIVWGTSLEAWDDNIVWGTTTFEREGDNIVWGTFSRDAEDNIVWGNTFTWDENIVWGNTLFGIADGDNIVWGNTALWDGDADNIVWGNFDEENIVWGNVSDEDNIVWGATIVVGRVQ
jgi:serine protease AprX